MSPFPRLILASLASTLSLSASDHDLLKIVSDDTDLLIHLADLTKSSEHWQSSSLREFFEQDQISSSLKEIFDNFPEPEGDDFPELAEPIKENLLELSKMVTGELLFSLQTPTIDGPLFTRFQDATEGKEIATLITEEFSLLLLAEVSEDKDKLTELLQTTAGNLEKLFEEYKGEEEYRLESETTDNIEIWTLTIRTENTDFKTLSFGLADQTLFLTAGKKDPSELIKDIREGHRAPIADSPFLRQDHHDIQIFGNLTDALAPLKVSLATAQIASGLNLIEGWEALSLQEFGPFSLAFSLGKKHLTFDYQIQYPTKGLFSTLTSTDPIKNLSKLPHQDTISFIQTQIHWESLYDAILDLIEKTAPDASATIDDQISTLQETLNLDLRDDLLRSLGTHLEVLQYPGPTPTATETNYALSLEVTDQGKLEDLLKTLATTMAAEISQEEFLGQTLFHLPLGPADAGLSYAFHQDKILLGPKAHHPVKEILKQLHNPRPPLWETPPYRDHPDLFLENATELSVSQFGDQIGAILDLEPETDVEEDTIDWSQIQIPYHSYLDSAKVVSGLRTGKITFLPAP